ncbi:MAG: transglutaminase domain-containing protein [Anaerolineales bacterium]|nr:transglutaminase domain-containing protein [Anaerolineales bacterium]
MKRLPASPSIHWWDWTSVSLLMLLLQTVAARLSATEWIPFLGMVQIVAWMGLAIGLALGYSALSRRLSRWLSFFYMALMLPLQWTTIIEGPVMPEEKLLSIGGRLLASFSDFFAQRPVEDPLFFLSIVTVAFWALSTSAGYQLIKRQNFIAATLPSMIGILIIQNYDNAVRGRTWIMAFFVLFALFLLGRLNFLQEQKRWKEKRVFLSPENGVDLSSGMAIAAGLLIVFAWTIPPSLTKIDALRQTWSRIAQPWTEFTNRFENAVSALESPAGGAPGGEFYGSQLELGLGFSLSESVMFIVEAPDLPFGVKPPRYYWRGRVYDNFSDGHWSATGTSRADFSPDTPLPNIAEEEFPANFIFRVGQQPVTLLYTPARALWISRPGSTVNAAADEDEDILSWSAKPGLLPGETYQTKAALNNPNIQELRAAGVEYPAWVTDKYLQVPEDLSPRISALAREITEDAETPYDKASVITSYLRQTIEYSPTVPEPPFNADPLEWVLFRHKKAFCVYYASIEVMMLRSLGIPARMAVGFSQGAVTTNAAASGESDEALTSYTVRKLNAHAWPEVFFPGIGWVEFEPTGNQEPLNRPLAPRGDSTSSGLTAPNLAEPDLEPDAEPDENLPAEEPSVSTIKPLSPLAYSIPIVLGIIALGLFLSRRHAIPQRIPSFVRSAIERGGAPTPNWVLNWERWAGLSAVEKAFDSVNFALRQLKTPLPLHATAAERADKLADILPNIAPIVKILLDEHQTSLYTSRTADVRQAKRAARTIRFQTRLARLRRFLTGEYSPHPD